MRLSALAATVVHSIENQVEHHSKHTFEQEYMSLLAKIGYHLQRKRGVLICRRWPGSFPFTATYPAFTRRAQGAPAASGWFLLMPTVLCLT